MRCWDDVFRARAAGLMLVAILLAACAGDNETASPISAGLTPTLQLISIDLPTAAPTATAFPSSTPSITPTPAPPTATPIPFTPVPTSAADSDSAPAEGWVTSVREAEVRSGPGDTFDVILTVEGNYTFNVVTVTDNRLWYLIEMPPYQRGWIASRDILHTPSEEGGVLATTSSSADLTDIPGIAAEVSGTQGVNIRNGASFFHDRLVTLDTGASLTIIGRTLDSSWYEVITVEGQYGWALADLIAPGPGLEQIAITWAEQPPACGVNIQPRNGYGDLPIPSALAEVQWVRFPYTSSRAHFASLEDAFSYYDPIVNAYNALDVDIILVVGHQTYGENEGYDWGSMDSGRWRTYTAGFVPVLERIVRHYGNRVAAYEIWNEGDAQPGNPAAVPFPPADYAPLLDQSAQVIRRYAPGATIVFGGLMSGSRLSAEYVQATRAALGGRLPVDVIGVHPYGLGSADDTTRFSPFGSLEDVFTAMHRVAPDVPLWVTEAGALGSDAPLEAARYLRNLMVYMSTTYSKAPVFIWYPWSDNMHAEMRPNGLVTASGTLKPYLSDVFFQNACQGLRTEIIEDE